MEFGAEYKTVSNRARMVMALSQFSWGGQLERTMSHCAITHCDYVKFIYTLIIGTLARRL